MGNERVKFVVAQLLSAFPHGNVTDATVAIYLRLLSDIPVDELSIVVDQSIAECKFLPTVAEIRERYQTLTKGLGQKAAAEAWGDVVDEIRRVGYMSTPEFEDALTDKVVKQMGWRELCMSEKPGVERAQFMRMYESMAARDTQVSRLLPQSRTMAAKRIGLTSVSKLLGVKDDHRSG